MKYQNRKYNQEKMTNFNRIEAETTKYTQIVHINIKSNFKMQSSPKIGEG